MVVGEVTHALSQKHGDLFFFRRHCTHFSKSHAVSTAAQGSAGVSKPPLWLRGSSPMLLCADAVGRRDDRNPAGSAIQVAVLWEGFCFHLYFQATSKHDKVERK